MHTILFLSEDDVITPHAQRERGKVIDRGVHICLWSKKIFESYFSDRLTFSNIDSRTSRRIYRLALLLRAPETLSSLSKSRISIFKGALSHFRILLSILLIILNNLQVIQVLAAK